MTETLRVLVPAVILSVGLTLGVVFLVPYGKDAESGPSAACIVLRQQLAEIRVVPRGQGDSFSRHIVERYNEECR